MKDKSYQINAKITSVDKNYRLRDATMSLELTIPSKQAGIWNDFDCGDNVKVRIRKISEEVKL